MTVSREYLDYLLEILTPLGGVVAKRMFGGAGLYLDGRMFAIVVDDQLWLKADATNRGEFEARELPPFSYARQGKLATMGFYRAPDEALESPALLLPWARSALGAALRAAAGKKGRN
jgi:DNA transformation protein and related proteins